jgi:hypothetical protein
MKKTIYIFAILLLIFYYFDNYNNYAIENRYLCFVTPTSGDWISVDPPTLTWYQGPDTPACQMVGAFYHKHEPPLPLPCPSAYGEMTSLFIVSWDSCYTLPDSVWLSIPLDTNCWYMRNYNIFSQNHVLGGLLQRLAGALPPTTLLNPLNGEAGISVNPLLKWHIVDSATSYRIKIYNSRLLNNVVFDSTVINDSIRVPFGRLNSYFTYHWRVKALKTGGVAPFSDAFYFTTTSSSLIRIISNNVSESFSLKQNYPNPFNPITKIKFDIPLSRGVPEGRGVLTRLTIYDILGHEVAMLVNENLSPGTYEAEWDASNYPSGVYFYKLETETYSQTKKLILIK